MHILLSVDAMLQIAGPPTSSSHRSARESASGAKTGQDNEDCWKQVASSRSQMLREDGCPKSPGGPQDPMSSGEQADGAG